MSDVNKLVKLLKEEGSSRNYIYYSFNNMTNKNGVDATPNIAFSMRCTCKNCSLHPHRWCVYKTALLKHLYAKVVK